MALTTDATPRIHLTPAQVLQDEQRMTRLKTALCDGLFTYADEQAATQIFDETLKICGGSAETLSEVIQTPFFMKYTPFHCIIANRPPTKPGTPPLLARFLSICETLNQQTQEEIIAVLGHMYDSGVYIAVRPKLTGVLTHEVCNTSVFQDALDQPVITFQPKMASANELYFHIPKFFDRLAVEGEVWMEFLALGAHFRFKASVEDSRSPSVNRARCQIELKATCRTYQGNFSAYLVLSSAGLLKPGFTGTQFFDMSGNVSESTRAYFNGMTPNSLHRRLNPNSSLNRDLTGTLTFS